MTKNNDISLVCATLDSTEDVSDFLKNLTKCIREVEEELSVHLILIDQFEHSREGDFLKINPNIKYLHSQKKGLALNRNLGTPLITSSAHAFIDCDCRIDASYFRYFLEITKHHSDISMIYGKILSLENSADLFKKWPQKKQYISKLDRWLISTSVNIIYLGKPRLFDENFGIGATYGSCEDIDLALRVPGKAIYTPKLKIYHPSQVFSENSNEKIFNYAMGFGALCKKHTGIYSKLMFSLSILSSFKKLIFLQCNYSQFESSLKGKLVGFFKFKH